MYEQTKKCKAVTFIPPNIRANVRANKKSKAVAFMPPRIQANIRANEKM